MSGVRTRAHSLATNEWPTVVPLSGLIDLARGYFGHSALGIVSHAAGAVALAASCQRDLPRSHIERHLSYSDRDSKQPIRCVLRGFWQRIKNSYKVAVTSGRDGPAGVHSRTVTSPKDVGEF